MPVWQSIVVFTVAFVVTYAMVPVSKRIAFAIGAIDFPGDRRVNEEIVPRAGGIALYTGFMAGCLALLVCIKLFDWPFEDLYSVRGVDYVQLFLGVTDMAGLYYNLLLPKMDWENEEAVVKRGASALLSMLTGMALIGISAGAYFLFFIDYLTVDIYLLSVAGVFLLLAVGLYFLLMTNGVKRFEKIHKGV